MRVWPACGQANSPQHLFQQRLDARGGARRARQRKVQWLAHQRSEQGRLCSGGLEQQVLRDGHDIAAGAFAKGKAVNYPGMDRQRDRRAVFRSLLVNARPHSTVAQHQHLEQSAVRMRVDMPVVQATARLDSFDMDEFGRLRPSRLAIQREFGDRSAARFARSGRLGHLRLPERPECKNSTGSGSFLPFALACMTIRMGENRGIPALRACLAPAAAMVHSSSGGAGVQAAGIRYQEERNASPYIRRHHRRRAGRPVAVAFTPSQRHFVGRA
jgi:hypothetical protein